MPARGLWAVQQTELCEVCFRSKTEGGHISPFSVYNLFIVYPCFPINKLWLINLKSIFKTPKQSYSVSKNFSSKHRAAIFRHSSVATTYKFPKYNEFTKLGMLLMHLHRMYNNQLIAMLSLHKFTDFSRVLWDQRQCRRAAVWLYSFQIVCTGRWQSCCSFHSIRQLKLWLTRRFTYFRR